MKDPIFSLAHHFNNFPLMSLVSFLLNTVKRLAHSHFNFNLTPCKPLRNIKELITEIKDMQPRENFFDSTSGLSR